MVLAWSILQAATFFFLDTLDGIVVAVIKCCLLARMSKLVKVYLIRMPSQDIGGSMVAVLHLSTILIGLDVLATKSTQSEKVENDDVFSIQIYLAFSTISV